MKMHTPKLRISHARRGASLIDVAIGSMLMATLLIPSMNLINESRVNAQRLKSRQSLLEDAEQIVETTKLGLSEPSAFASAMVRPVDETRRVPTRYGAFAITRVRVDADASVRPAELLTVLVDAWHDDDSNGRLDTGEMSVTLRTQWAAP